MKYKNICVNYMFYDNKSQVSLVYLHGWGQNIDMMMPIAKPFIDTHNVLLIDLPGFGLSDEPKEVWSLYDYADMVHYMVSKLKIKNVILIGHSFGGKISIVYSIKYKPIKIVLLASPYRVKKSKETFKVKILRKMKSIPVLNKLEGFAKNHMGSTDYRNASAMMKNILVKHVNLDLTSELDKIKCPTLLIWGTLDKQVPYEDALLLEKSISNCGLVTYEGCTHYAYLERLKQTINVLKSFMGESEKK